MNPESSPFRPGQPVPTEFFVGRTAEIERLRGMVRGSAEGRFRIGFVSGERGIGKSSLAAFVRRLVERDHDAVGCHVFLGGVQDLGEMLRRSFDRLLKESIDRPWHNQVKDFFGNRVRQVGLFGVTLELDLSDTDVSAIRHDFVPSIRRLLEELDEHKKSLFLILDDINGLARSDDFANWLKSSVDEIATSEEQTRLCILVVGLEERRLELLERQPSLARVFELIDISPWSDGEVRDFYRNSFRLANATIAEKHLHHLARYTGGLPVLAHEIGDAVWRTARTREVRTTDVSSGIAAAAEVIGRKLLEPRIFRAVRSERYRAILRRIAAVPRTRFTRAELLERLPEEEKRVLDAFLRRMKALGALQSDPQVKGGYRFPNRLHALYFFAEASRAHSPTQHHGASQ
ncbi:MAG: ATP-binding protein [Acidobacteria bacterium]|nr:ATP-binding protein [Acidobacteriota bacterium]